jgi:hypothetical protein
MGFSPDVVGLGGERISGVYNEPRPTEPCPFHRGMVTSSLTPKPFSAGIYGRVVAPLATGWGTVAVSIGDAVAPWTILGRTGNTVPPGHRWSNRAPANMHVGR